MLMELRLLLSYTDTLFCGLVCSYCSVVRKQKAEESRKQQVEKTSQRWSFFLPNNKKQRETAGQAVSKIGRAHV